MTVYRRWRLREHVDADDVAAVAREAIVPMYERLSDDVALGLELCADGRSVLAIQRWRSRGAMRQALSGPCFDRWWAEYQPTLARWETMVEFESEWETVELVGTAPTGR